jgi:hypothetical protein
MATVLLAGAGLLSWSTQAVSAPLKTTRMQDVATRFKASADGFGFLNRAGAAGSTWLGKVFPGVCGGMSYAALDYYWAGRRPPSTAGVDGFVLNRNAQSLVANASSFVAWTVAPDTPTRWSPFGVAIATRRDQLPALADALKRGPVPLGLVKARDLRHIGENHQLVAYAIRSAGSTVRVSVYDPNEPKADDAVLQLDLAKPSAPVLEYRGARVVDVWRGFFIERYSPAKPPKS